ncbi:MAG: hypothetical protein AVDCRST_MAG89-4166 [uncultured Gemmatimonadetes bacterium]|uniref:Uncharacterized protein n=1 Tax=uncultured Gemmatimonadota bacterium TaxID=203437 RepID=A0A6J4MRQ3_9BACT|nr:MAG: hypothetical protein AVDCRST_MAG89-4166 [uncultured Gemmatimonadota bacterium]
MTQPNEAPRQARDSDRRGNDRRNLERRAPPPPWRRPWAYAAYGVAGALVLMLLIRGMGGDDPPRPTDDAPMVTREPGAPGVAPPAEATTKNNNAPVEAAFGAAGFERLVLQGPAAIGKTVKAELYCEQPTSYQVRTNVDAEAPVAALAANGRIPAAECKWGGANDPRRENFLLLVPPDLADDFAATPVINDDFQRRRRLVANVEWVGRSQALELRTAGVFRGLAR